MLSLNWYALFPGVSFVCSFIFAFYIRKKAPENRLATLYFWLTINFGLWGGTHFLTFVAPSAQFARNINFLSIFHAGLTAGFFVLFILNFVKSKWGNSKYIFLFFLEGVIGAYLTLTTDLISTGATKVYWGYLIIRGPLYSVHSFYVAACVIFGLIILIRYYLKVEDINIKKQTLIVITAFTFPVVGGILTEVIAPVINFKIMPLSDSFGILVVIFIAYAILKYEFLLITPLRAVDVIVKTMADLLVVFDIDNRVVFVNDAFLNTTKYEKEEIIKKDISMMFKDKRVFKKIVNKIDIEKVARNIECKIFDKEKKEIIVSVSGAHVMEYNAVLGYTFSMQNITTRKKYQSKVEKINKKLVVKNKELERFNKIAIGREMKMIELKKKIKELEEQVRNC